MKSNTKLIQLSLIGSRGLIMTDEQILEWLLVLGSDWVSAEKMVDSPLARLDWMHAHRHGFLDRQTPADIGKGWYSYKLTEKSIRRIQNETR
jgi:hypothetical protein